jgi:hypothetical protein
MTRTVALRASVVFVALTGLFGALGLSAYTPIAEILFLISASVGGLMLGFAVATPRHAPVPVRIRSRASARRG